MKQGKNTLFLLLTGFFILLFQTGYSQVENVDQEQKAAQISYSLKKGVAVYSFTPLTDFDEFRTAQRVDRINGLTGDSATVKSKNQTIYIALNPALTSGENLERLLLAIVRIHGYSHYQLN